MSRKVKTLDRERPSSDTCDPSWAGLYPERVSAVLSWLERRSSGHWLCPLQDAAGERISRLGPVWDGKHSGTQAMTRSGDANTDPHVLWQLLQEERRKVRALSQECDGLARELEVTHGTPKNVRKTFIERWRSRVKRVTQ